MQNTIIISKTVEEVLEGEREPISAWVELYDLKKEIEAAMEQIKECTISECEKYPKSTASNDGRTVSVSYTTRYNYSENADYAELQDRTKALAEKLKMGYYDEEKGLGVPPVSSNVSVSVTVKKVR